ncbi:chorismate mutase [Streptacidiphilus sp. MAP12-20]|uniref:chorismate mutase n=1 Tax=Streptacidiphilus sp. MAP12-20 TaxID=3156299 RepID=UPI003517304D
MSIETTTSATATSQTATSQTMTSDTMTKEAAETVIADARGRIDALDAEILDLLRRRIAVSAEVQAARIATGGPRLSLTREMEILDRYRARLGRPGTEIAMLMLELCRGRV